MLLALSLSRVFKVRYVYAALLVLAIVAALPMVNAEWVLYKKFYVDGGYTITAARMIEDGTFLVIGATDNAGNCIIYVLYPEMQLDHKYSITNCDGYVDFDARGPYLAAIGVRGSSVIVTLIDHLGYTVLGTVELPSASPISVAFSGDYIYALVYNVSDGQNYVYIMDTSLNMVGNVSLGAGSVDLERAEWTDLLVYFTPDGTVYVADGRNGALNIIGSFVPTDTNLIDIAATYNDNDGFIYIAAATGGTVYLYRYDYVTDYVEELQLETYDMSFESRYPMDVSVTFVDSKPAIYVVTNDGFGYRVVEFSNVTIEALHRDSVGMIYYGGEDISYSILDYAAYAWKFTKAVEYVTTTVTTTTTATQVLVEEETETVTTTTTVYRGYDAGDLFLIGMVGILLGCALAYLLIRRH